MAFTMSYGVEPPAEPAKAAKKAAPRKRKPVVAAPPADAAPAVTERAETEADTKVDAG